MENYISDFNKYVVYLKDVIENVTIALQQNGSILDDPITYKIFDNYGDFSEESHEVEVGDKTTPVFVCIRNDGGIIDNTAAVSTYLQAASIEVLAPFERKNDISLVFNTIALDYSKHLVKIDNKPTVLLIGDLPEYSDTRDDIIGAERFQINIPISFIIYTDTMLSDEISFKINGEPINIKSWALSATDELEADNKFGYKDGRSRFIYNISGLVFKIDYFYQPNNSQCQLLFTNALTNSNIGQVFKVEMFGEDKDAPLVEFSLIHKSTEINAASGSLIEMTTEFWPYSNLGTTAEEA